MSPRQRAGEREGHARGGTADGQRWGSGTGDNLGGDGRRRTCQDVGGVTPELQPAHRFPRKSIVNSKLHSSYVGSQDAPA